MGFSIKDLEQRKSEIQNQYKLELENLREIYTEEIDAINEHIKKTDKIKKDINNIQKQISNINKLGKYISQKTLEKKEKLEKQEIQLDNELSKINREFNENRTINDVGYDINLLKEKIDGIDLILKSIDVMNLTHENDNTKEKQVNDNNLENNSKTPNTLGDEKINSLELEHDQNKDVPFIELTDEQIAQMDSIRAGLKQEPKQATEESREPNEKNWGDLASLLFEQEKEPAKIDAENKNHGKKDELTPRQRVEAFFQASSEFLDNQDSLDPQQIARIGEISDAKSAVEILENLETIDEPLPERTPQPSAAEILENLEIIDNQEEYPQNDILGENPDKKDGLTRRQRLYEAFLASSEDLYNQESLDPQQIARMDEILGKTPTSSSNNNTTDPDTGDYRNDIFDILKNFDSGEPALQNQDKPVPDDELNRILFGGSTGIDSTMPLNIPPVYKPENQPAKKSNKVPIAKKVKRKVPRNKDLQRKKGLLTIAKEYFTQYDEETDYEINLGMERGDEMYGRRKGL